MEIDVPLMEGEKLTREGEAYAVLTDAGELVFFRSEEKYKNRHRASVRDVLGNEYEGVVFAGVENTEKFYNFAPWYKQRSRVKSARIADGQVIAPVSCVYWFYYCRNMTAFEGAERLDTSKVTSMYGMFECCHSLATPPDTSNWDTGKVTNMNGMFRRCASLTSAPDTSRWDTSNVVNMGLMFSGCSAMTEPPAVSSWDTSAVFSMGAMFYGCSAMTEQPDISEWDTGNVRYMDSMFDGCESLEGEPEPPLPDRDENAR